MAEKLITIQEAAEFLGYGKKIGPLYMLVHRRTIPFVRLGEKILRFRISDLEAYISSRTMPAEPGHDPKPVPGRKRGRPRKNTANDGFIDRVVTESKKEVMA